MPHNSVEEEALLFLLKVCKVYYHTASAFPGTEHLLVALCLLPLQQLWKGRPVRAIKLSSTPTALSLS